MKRFVSYVLVITGVVFCIYFLVSSFTCNFNSISTNEAKLEKENKIQNNISVKSITKHLLDFNR